MIDSIIFDFGDIFINLDKHATPRIMNSYGLNELTPEMNRINEDYERGLVSTDNLVGYYHGLLPKVPKSKLIKAWNAIILDFPQHRLDFIENLARKNTHRLFLLSNTNELHIEQVQEIMGLQQYQRFKSCFEQFYLSHEIHHRKPDMTIYKYVIETNRLIPEKTLFIDDTKENIDAAAQIGIKTWHLTPGKDDVIDLLDKDFMKR
ncbi:HAD-IA family hydrolase [Leptobacterium sp. I13]|uniref:HAD-IA family hydrolase n=1 Tax=Leptobacterium meishanense TaxID=3128904 RepID=UPI0030EC4D28